MLVVKQAFLPVVPTESPEHPLQTTPPIMSWASPVLPALLCGASSPSQFSNIHIFVCWPLNPVGLCNPMDYVACKTPLSIFLVDTFSVKGLLDIYYVTVYFLFWLPGDFQKETSVSFSSQTLTHTYT